MWLSAERTRVRGSGEIKVVYRSRLIRPGDSECELGVRDFELGREAARVTEVRETECLFRLNRIFPLRRKQRLGTVELCPGRGCFTLYSLPRLAKLEIGESRLRVCKVDGALCAQSIEDRQADRDT